MPCSGITRRLKKGYGSRNDSFRSPLRAVDTPILNLIHNSLTLSINTTDFSPGGTLHLVSGIKVHELYNIPIRDNDVAVVLMTTAIDQTVSVARLAFIPYQGAVVPDNASVTAVGWGLTTVSYSQF